MNRKTILAGALAVATLAAGTVVAQPGGGFGGGRGHGGKMHGHGGHGGPGGFAAFGKLDLTDDQKAQLKELMARQRDEMKPLRDQERDARLALREAIDGGADATKVGQLTLALEGVRKQVRARHEAARDQFVTLLTPEQKEKFEEMQAERKKHMEERKERFEQKRDSRK
jgi:protein CpxP